MEERSADCCEEAVRHCRTWRARGFQVIGLDDRARCNELSGVDRLSRCGDLMACRDPGPGTLAIPSLFFLTLHDSNSADEKQRSVSSFDWHSLSGSLEL